MAIELAVNNDLPDELRKQLTQQYLKGGTDREQFLVNLKKLFNEKSILSVDEIIVGWYHAYNNEILKRNAVSMRLTNLVKDGELIKQGRTKYGLCKKTQPEG